MIKFCFQDSSIYSNRNYLQRQHKLRLKAQAEIVSQELEDDRRALDELAELESNREEADHREKQRRCRELQWMQEVSLHVMSLHDN